MEISAMATAAIAILAPYLAKAGEEAAKKAGNAAWAKAAELMAVIKTRFKKEKDEKPTKILEGFEKAPENSRAEMEAVLEKLLAKDAKFSKTVFKLLKEAEKAGANTEFNVQVFGDQHGDIFNINKVEGGLRIDKRSRN
jgi:hypothetical protein